MIDGECHCHDRAWHDDAAADDGRRSDRPDGEDRGMWRVDDCRELFSPEHAKVGDRYRAAFKIAGRQRVAARPVHQLRRTPSDPGDGEVLHRTDYWGDE